MLRLLGRRARGGRSVDQDRLPVPRDFFAFDLASVETYLVADRVLKAAPPGLRWMPSPASGFDAAGLDGDALAAEKRAAELGLPLHVPLPESVDAPRAMRAAQYAAAQGYGGAFMQLCSRLRFAGGFDIDGHVLESLNVSGAPRSFGMELAVSASDARHDLTLAHSATRLAGEGVSRLPALRIDERLACGHAAIINLIDRSPLSPGRAR
jgi:hypothetical protein